MQKTATSKFEVIATNVVLQEPTFSQGAPWRPHGTARGGGEDLERHGEYVTGSIAKMSDGRLLGKSCDGRFSWIDPQTMRGSFDRPVDWERWHRDVVAGFRDGAIVLQIPPPTVSAKDAEFAIFKQTRPIEWEYFSKLHKVSIEPAPAAKFKFGPVRRPRPGADGPLPDLVELVQRHTYRFDFGDHGVFDPSPPSEEELYALGSDFLSIARTNSINIQRGLYPIRSQYGRVGVATVRLTETGPATLVVY